MNCILKEIVGLDPSGICPFAGKKCDGEMNINWSRSFAIIPENKVCISQTKDSTMIQVRAADLDRIKNGQGVLLINTGRGGNVYVKIEEERC